MGTRDERPNGVYFKRDHVSVRDEFDSGVGDQYAIPVWNRERGGDERGVSDCWSGSALSFGQHLQEYRDTGNQRDVVERVEAQDHLPTGDVSFKPEPWEHEPDHHPEGGTGRDAA